MRFSCSTTDLNDALNVVSRALAIRSPKPIFEGVLLESCDEGLKLTCTDLALGINTVIPASFFEEGRAVLPGKLLCDVVRKLPGERVECTINERYQASIRSANARTNLLGLDPIEYPELPSVTGSSFSMPQNTLRDMIARTSFAIAMDESRPILTGCLLKASSQEMSVVALDGFRLAMRTEQIEGPERDVSAVVGGKMLVDIGKILSDTDEQVELCFSKSHMRMEMGSTHIVARLLEGEYINYQQILPNEWQTMTTVGRGELSDAIDRASLIAREARNNLVHFRIERDSMEISSSAELGDTQETIKALTTGKDLTISFNVRYIADVLKAVSDDEIVMRFNTNISPCVFCPVSGESYQYLVLPVRTFNS